MEKNRTKKQHTRAESSSQTQHLRGYATDWLLQKKMQTLSSNKIRTEKTSLRPFLSVFSISHL